MRVIRKKIRIALIGAAVLVLLGSIALSAYLFFSNYQNVQLLRQAQNNFRQGDAESLKLAEAQLLQLIRNDADNERAFILLAQIAKQKKIYPEQAYYTLHAHRLNPLSEENENAYIEALLYAREFERLEMFLAQKSSLSADQNGFLLYAAGQNGNIGKYRQTAEHSNDDLIAELALLLYKHTHIKAQERIFILQDYLSRRSENDFHKQEILAALVSTYLAQNDHENAEKYLLEAYKLNEFAFAPVLGRFYANYRSLAKALEVFEKYLAIYHDPTVALQTAEICCLLKKRDKISALNKKYQADSGKGALLLNYYFEVLDKFAANDLAAAREYLAPLQKAINTPLATFIYLCAELDGQNLAVVYQLYNSLLAQRSYLDLQFRADRLVIRLVKKSIPTAIAQDPMLLKLAETVYWRMPDATVGKFLLLTQRQKGNLNFLLLSDLQKSFPKDQGVNKIAVEHYINNDFATAEKLIAAYMQNFQKQKADMLRYRIILALRQKKFDQASQLFRQNFSPEIAGEYWNFAINTNRLEDLRYLTRSPQYKPFCEAAILLANGKKAQALDILAKADAKNNQMLLFYAAKTLAENDRLKEALFFYNKFPENSSYKLPVLLNSAELHQALGNPAEAERLAKKAYQLAPDLPEVQYCYADKLYQSGRFSEIADFVRLTPSSPYSSRIRKFLIASLEFCLKNSDLNREKDKILNQCDRLLRISPDNKIALEYRQKAQSLLKKE